MVALQTENSVITQGGPTSQNRAMRRVCAAIDLGTNNCRLLIARSGHGGFHVIDAFSRIVRLGEGLSRSDRLTEQAMVRTLAALRICSAKIRGRSATTVRAVGTEACRRACNGQEFVAKVRMETGIDVEIISSQEEGRLALAGCSPLLDPGFPLAVVFDIGGGSTELLWLKVGPDGPVVVDQVSIRLGVIDLVESYGADHVDPATYRTMVGLIAERLSAFEMRNQIAAAIAGGGVQMLGTSGTVTTLAGIALGLSRYERSQVDGSVLEAGVALKLIHELVGLNYGERAAISCIGPDRADLIVAGCAVLEAILTVLPVPRLRIADRGLREGILADLMNGGRTGWGTKR